MGFAVPFLKLLLLVKTISAIEDEDSKPIGGGCIFDRQCDSKHCGGFKCVECEDDSHCEGKGFSAQGAAPFAFCVENKCSQWKRGKPLDSKGYALNLGAPIWIPRKITSGSQSFEMIRFDLGEEVNSELKVNATHAHIPMNVHLFGEYAVDNKVTGVKESGIVNLIYAKNPLSIILDNPLFGCAEKYHTIKEEGTVNTLSAERVKKERSGRKESQNKYAHKNRFYRDNLVSQAVAIVKSGNKLVEVAQDIKHMNQIRGFVKEEGGKKGVKELWASDQYKSLRTKAKEGRNTAKTVPSQKTMNHCRHWGDESPVTITDTHVVIPLGTNMFAAAGKTQFSPWRWFQIANGFTVFDFNKEDNTLEMIQVYTDMFHLNMDGAIDPAGLPPNGFFVGPADGMDMEVDEEDGRIDEYYEEEMSFFGKYALSRIGKYDPDYERLYMDPLKSCTDEEREGFELSFAKAKKDYEDPNYLQIMWTAVNVLDATTDSLDCGINYLRTSQKYGNAVDILEYSVWIHFVMESDIDDAVQAATNSHFWDYGVTMPAGFEEYESQATE